MKTVRTHQVRQKAKPHDDTKVTTPAHIQEINELVREHGPVRCIQFQTTITRLVRFEDGHEAVVYVGSRQPGMNGGPVG